MGETKKEYTIADLARELGVSKSTVSRAISGKGRISAGTRARVRQLIEQHGYRPNMTAKALADSRTYNIGLILPEEYAQAEFSFFHECMSGICEAAYEANYDVVISVLTGPDLSQLHRMLARRKVDGVILSRADGEASVQRLLQECGMPFVVIGPFCGARAARVDNQNEEACQELTGLMLMKGMRRLALIGGSRRHLVTGSRYAGFRRAHEEYGVFLDEGLVFLDVENQFQTNRAADQILSAGAEGILCMDDVLTGFVLSHLREKGVQIPGEIRLASFYDSPQLEYTAPPVTGLRFDTKELGRNACRTLLRLLGESVPEAQPKQNYQVILRESTK